MILRQMGKRLLLIQERTLSLQTSRVFIFGRNGMRIALTFAPFFQQTVFLTSGLIAIATRNGCRPASPTTLIALP